MSVPAADSLIDDADEAAPSRAEKLREHEEEEADDQGVAVGAVAAMSEEARPVEVKRAEAERMPGAGAASSSVSLASAALPEAEPRSVAKAASSSVGLVSVASASELMQSHGPVLSDRVDAPASASGLFHVNRRAPETKVEVKQPEPKQDAGGSRWPVFMMGIAASVALIFVAQSALQSTGSGEDGLDVPGKSERTEPTQVLTTQPSVPPQPHPEKRPPDAKKDPLETSAGSVVVGPEASPGSASGGSAESADPATVGHEETAGSAETSGPPPVAEDDDDTHDATSTLPHSTTAQVNDSGGAPVRPPPAKPAQSFDDLVIEGCNQVYFGDAGKALPLLMQAFDMKPRNLRLLECVARANMALNRYETAENYFLRILKIEPRSRKALLGAAEANEKLTRLGNAAMYYEQLRSQEPKNPSAAKFFEANPAYDTRRGPQ